MEISIPSPKLNLMRTGRGTECKKSCAFNQNKLRTLENQASRTPIEYEDVEENMDEDINDVVEKVENVENDLC